MTGKLINVDKPRYQERNLVFQEIPSFSLKPERTQGSEKLLSEIHQQDVFVPELKSCYKATRPSGGSGWKGKVS